MTKDEALRLALEALKKSDGFLYNWHENSSDDEADAYATVQQLNEKAITAIKAALEAKDEPDYKALWQQMCERCDELDKKLAQRKPLTDEQVRNIIDAHTTDDFGYDIWCDAVGVARAIEAAHGIK